MRAIDADKLLRNIEKYHVSDGKFQHWVQIQQTIEPERKKGKWLKSYADHEAFGIRPFFRYCSECNEATVHAYNYCPNCGADMRGDDHDL